MTEQTISYLTISPEIKLAYQQIPGKSPGVIFCNGFMSDMTGSKASALRNFCQTNGYAFTGFDYRGHGQSSGELLHATISDWRDDALAVLDELTHGPQIIIGSSMGGWIGLLSALARPERISGFIGIAAAPDFTEELIWQTLTEEERTILQREKIFYQASLYSEKPYPFTWQLIADGRKNLLLNNSIDLPIPLRLLHGMQDPDVPWQTSLRIAEKVQTQDVRVVLVKDGDHRLAREQDLQLLTDTLAELLS